MKGTTTNNKKKMLATLVGCNYGGTAYELRGCINDVLAMRDTLVARFGFSSSDITVLTDDGDHGSAVIPPTGGNIKRALGDMVSRASPRDVLFFHYSGHGTLVPRRHGHGGHDEAIVPCDFNLITDVDFRQLVDKVPEGATFTVLSDSCHSGGLIDQEKEQIGPDVVQDKLAGGAMDDDSLATLRGRFVPYGAVVGHLAGASGVDASHHVGDHLVALFGADASAKWNHHHHQKEHVDGDGGVLLSGCQTDETSADVAAAGEEGKACGAFSSAVQAVLAAHPAAALSNREVVTGARKLLSEKGFEQHPCLYCSDANADAPFLSQQHQAAMTMTAL